MTSLKISIISQAMDTCIYLDRFSLNHHNQIISWYIYSSSELCSSHRWSELGREEN